MHCQNIILFSDGTGNSAGKLFRTNVWRVYQALDLKDPQVQPLPRQVAFYDDGVGTSSFKPLAILGGAIGVGLARNVKELYAYLCRTYRTGDSAKGFDADKIYAFGFSRGAFTIRVLMGLILTQGLVKYTGDETKLERDVAAAWRQYRRERYNTTGGLVDVFRGIRDGVVRLRNAVAGYDSFDDVVRIGGPSGRKPSSDPARPDEDRPIEIEFLGLWDTVDAYGLPVDELTRAVDTYLWPLSMPDHDLNPRVKRAMHALSLDDERNAFHPRLWNESAGDVVRAGQQQPPAAPTAPWPDTSRVNQVWFAGVHANLGGGYPDDTLSFVPLLWILQGAEAAGLRFEPQIVAEYEALADENGPIYDSRKGLSSYYRYNPRRIGSVLAKDEITVQSIKVHESVFRRIKLGLDGYAPIVLPPAFEVVKVNGQIIDGATYLNQPGAPVLAPETEHVWNWVWRRRLAYYATLLVSLALLAMPLYAQQSPSGACESAFCFLASPIRWLSAVLPAFAGTWLEIFEANPGTFALLLASVLLFTTLGSSLSVAIGDRMRLAWYSLAATKPVRLAPRQPQPQSGLDRLIERYRCSEFHHALTWWTSRHILPALFVVAVVYGALAIATQIALAVSESAGGVCFDGDPSRSRETMATRSVCNALVNRVERGTIYRVKLTITEPWRDGPRLPATPNGILSNDAPWYMAAGVPLRRHIRQPWFRLIGRVGAKGTDTYLLEWRRMDQAVSASGSAETGQVWEAVFTARSSGRLFLYVNDATLYPWATPFYAANEGAARVEVEPELGSK